MSGQRTRLQAVFGLPLTSVNVCLWLFTLMSVIHAGESRTGGILSAPIRLVNGTKTATSLSGRLEVFVYGTWMTVCDGKSNDLTASTLCRILGYSKGYPVRGARYGQGTGVILLNDVVCSGNETSISQCSYLPIGKNDCVLSRDLGLICSNDTAISAPIRLVNGTRTATSLSGRLEVFIDGEWGTVCDDKSNTLTANTLCRILGYSLGYPLNRAGFGQGTGVIWLDDVVCSGNETSIYQCSHLPLGENNCVHQEDLGLMCSNNLAVSAPIRLVNGTKTASGLNGQLEVFIYDTWMTVCGEKSSDLTASTVCGILGYSKGYPVSRARNGQGTGAILLDDVVCSGNETSISQCSYLPIGKNDCVLSRDLGLICSNDTAISAPIRLVNGTRTATSLSGRLEVFIAGEWGTVCDDKSNILTANTLCRLLGYSQGYPLNRAGFGQGTGVIWLDDVVCSGNETSIYQCSHLPLGNNNCGHSEDLGLICSNNSAASIRLVNGTKTATSLSGRLEVFIYGTWGTVCDDKSNNLTASTLCRILGYSKGYPISSSRYGQGTGVILLDNVVCSGNETSISQCSHLPVENNYCGHRNDLGLICSNDTAISAPIRLVNGTKTASSLSGRLEVFIYGTWMTVCDKKSNELTASTLCRFLGYSKGYPVSRARYGQGTGVILLDDVMCSGNETSISECSHLPVGNFQCGPSKGLGLICSNDTAISAPIRLVNGTRTATSLSGRLEVFIDGEWGTVCDDKSNILTTNTLCRILGYSLGYPLNRALFGQGTGVIWLDDVVCSGNETSIYQCSHLPLANNNCGHSEDLGLICSNNSAVSAPIRLVNGTKTATSLSGRLEVFIHGTWGTVCEDKSNDLTASTLCRILGYSKGYTVSRTRSVRGTRIILLDDVVCSGNETSIFECSHHLVRDNYCRYNQELGLICSNDTAISAPIRLVNGTKTASSLSGRLEVFIDGAWGTVCDDKSNILTANTLCRILGYSLGYPVNRAAFGRGTGPIWLDDVVCSGNETSIYQCSHRPLGNNNCGHWADLGLICSKPTPGTSIRLVNGTRRANSLSGRLEVYHDNSWGTVCDDNFFYKSARTVCGLLGFSQGVELPNAYFGEGIGPIWLDEVRCSGNETDILQCSNGRWGEHNCRHDEDVGLVCFNPNPQERLSTRLVDGHRGSNYLTGRLEVFNAGLWGTACGSRFGSSSATVICRSLGYRNGNQVPRAQFGRASAPIWVDSVECLGREENIAQCLRGNWRRSRCQHGDDMGLYCYNIPFSGSVQTRLAGGDNGTGWQTGRLEVYFAEQWGTVCSSEFNSAAATVVCRSVGFRFGNYVYRSYPWVQTGMIWLGGATCRGNETNIGQCEHDGWGNHFCSHGSDVHIICSNSLPASNPCLLPSYEPCGSPTEGCFNKSDRCDSRWNCRNSFDESTC